MKRPVSLLLGLLLFPLLLQARTVLPLPHRSFPFLQGQHINGVFSDSRNRLWIGTNNGLYAWDGVNLAHYTTGDGLEDNEVLDSWGENNGRLWIRTHTNRLCFVDLRSGQIGNSALLPALKIRSPFVVKSVSFGPEGQVYVLSDVSHITLLDPVRQQVQHLPYFRLPRYLYHPPGNRGLLLQGYSGFPGRWFHRLEHGAWRPLQPCEDFIPCGYERLLYLFSTTGSSIYLWSNNGLLFLYQLPALRPGDKVLKFFVFSRDCMALVTQQQLLLVSGGSVYAYDCPGLNGITRDRDGNLWIAADDGLYFVPVYYRQVGTTPDVSTGLSPLPHAADSLLTASTDSSGTRWVAFLPADSHWQIGIGRQSGPGASGQYRHVGGVFKELLASGDTAYLRTDLLLLKLYPSADSLRCDTFSAARRTTAMYLGRNGELWFASLDSLYCRKGSRLSATALPGSHVVKVIGSAGPFMLVSNSDHFVHVYDPERQRYFTYSLPGRAGHYLEKIFDIDDRRKFLKTNECLYLLETGTTQVPQLHAIENPEPDPADIRDIRLRGDQVYLFTPETCYRYPLSLLTARKVVPALRLESLSYETASGTRQQRITAADGPATVALPSFVNNYSLAFAVDAAGRSRTEVEYALLREDDELPDWQPVRGREVKVALPRYGRTRIALRARSASSGFGAPRYCDVSLAPPFWYGYRFAVWCILAGIVLSTLVTHRIFRHYARKKEEKLTRDMQALQNEFRALNAMMNPHFIFNSLNSIQSFINTGDKKAANRYLLHFSRLIRQNMVNISANLIPVRQELEVLRHYLEIEQLRFEGRLQYSITLDAEATGYCTLPPLLIQPLAENAILHGLQPLQDRQPELHISVARRDEMLHITVQDNGVGYYNSRKQLPDRPSFGIGYIRKRLEKISAMTGQPCHFSIASEQGQPGTTIVMILPAGDD